MGKNQIKRAVFLDRDGVINQPVIRDGKPYPADLDNFIILPWVPQACWLLKRLGFVIIVASNQPDVGRGKLSWESVQAKHEWLLSQLPLDDVMTCYHGGIEYGQGCSCRKPKPGLLLWAAKEFKIDLGSSFMVGDRWRDIDCGYNAGCKTVFIDWGYQEKLKRKPDMRAQNLLDAAKQITKLESGGLIFEG